MSSYSPAGRGGSVRYAETVSIVRRWPAGTVNACVPVPEPFAGALFWPAPICTGITIWKGVTVPGVRVCGFTVWVAAKVTQPKKAITPAIGDQYDLYVDPYTNLIAYSDYIPAEVSTTQDFERATWEDYRHSGGLTMAAKHRLATKTITFENLSFAAE